MSAADTLPAGATRDGRTHEKLAAVSAAFIGLASGWPSSFGSTTTAFIVPLTQEFGWGRIVPSLMYTCSMGGLALASIWLGRLIERFGAGAVAAVSGLCLSAAMLLLSVQTGSIPLALGLSVAAGALGAGTGVGLYLSVLPRCFDRDLGRALAFSVIGQSAGLIIMPALASKVIASSGWRDAYATLALSGGGATLAVAGILWWLGRRAKVLPAAGGAASGQGMTLSEAIRTRDFRLLVAAIFLATVGIFGTVIHLFPLYIDRGVSFANLPALGIALGIGTLAGRVGSGLLLDPVEARLVAMVTFASGAAGIAWLAFSGGTPSTLDLALPPLLIGAALGAESDILAYMVRRFFGLRHYSAIYNRSLIAYYLGAVTGPLALGWAFDNLDAPRPALLALAACCLVAIGVAAALPSTRRPQAATVG